MEKYCCTDDDVCTGATIEEVVQTEIIEGRIFYSVKLIGVGLDHEEYRLMKKAIADGTRFELVMNIFHDQED